MPGKSIILCGMDIVRQVERELNGDVFSIGESEDGRSIYCVHKGSYYGRQLIVTAGMHARECYTALIALRQAAVFRERHFGVYFIPLVNPDGAAIFERGETALAHDFPLKNIIASQSRAWKANAQGVDLNCNFDCNFGGGKSNRVMPGNSDFIGCYPHCAAETAALTRFTMHIMPSATISYHAMGGELYWEYFQPYRRRRRDERIATAVAEHIGVAKVDGHLFSAGGYKDWCIQKLKIPALTIEAVKHGSHPLCPQDFCADVAANSYLPSLMAELLESKEW